MPVRLIERIAKFRARQLTMSHGSTGRRKGGREGQVDRIYRLFAALPSAFEKMSRGTLGRDRNDSRTGSTRLCSRRPGAGHKSGDRREELIRGFQVRKVPDVRERQ